MPSERSADRDERVSLAGLDPEAALRALLRVDPRAPPARDVDDEHDNQHDDEPERNR